MVSKLSEIRSWLFIPVPDPDFLPIPDPGVKKGTGSDPQHWSKTVFHVRKIGVPDSRSGSAPDLDLRTTLAKFVSISFWLRMCSLYRTWWTLSASSWEGWSLAFSPASSGMSREATTLIRYHVNPLINFFPLPSVGESLVSPLLQLWWISLKHNDRIANFSLQNKFFKFYIPKGVKLARYSSSYGLLEHRWFSL